VLSGEERAQLSALAASRSLPHAMVARAKLVLWAAAGESNRALAERLGWSLPTVGKWRARFIERRLAGLHDELRAGRPRSYRDEQVAGLIRRVLHSRPKSASHWSVRSVADATGISKSTVARYFALFGLQPHRAKSFKLSTDPFFVEKVRDVVGLYLNPPDKALVLCVDEKSQIQGAGAHSAGAADGSGLHRGRDPRLLSARHDHAVRGARRARRLGHRAMQAAPSAPGISLFP
jgi:putative transposase